jgi:hypothetical protein
MRRTCRVYFSLKGSQRETYAREAWADDSAYHRSVHSPLLYPPGWNLWVILRGVTVVLRNMPRLNCGSDSECEIR